MSTLQSSIEALAVEFATQLLAALRQASLEEVLWESGARAGRRGGSRAVGRPSGRAARRSGGSGIRQRRSGADISAVADRIVALVAKHADGIRGEQVRKELGIAKNHWMKPLGVALASKKLRKTGEKRATLYFPAK